MDLMPPILGFFEIMLYMVYYVGDYKLLFLFVRAALS